ncbi:MAG: hypothetical protein SD837_18165 [Candidatus Electrothrix scaldis]|nr:MAG: hypothetical protein SD837_18165 [Candidatus Electrothrix sp. GW3-3]
MSNYYDEITNKKEWDAEADILLTKNDFSEEFIAEFHSNWTVRGHRIREQINNDKKLAKLLEHIFPPYVGDEKTLYRGENKEKWEQNKVGFCWTTNKDTAEMFASGLNAINSGGLLLKCKCKPEWIIIGPSPHSNYLGESEYTVNPGLIAGVQILLEYDPVE